VQPTSLPQQEPLRYQLPLQSLTPRAEAYPGPYAYDYPGPDRPFPETRPRRGLRQRIPAMVLVGGAFGVAGVLPLALLVGAAVALGGLWGDNHVDWWLYPLLAAPALELWGAIWLLTRRSWWLLAVTSLPGVALFGYLVYEWFGGRPDVGLGWYTLGLAGPVIACLCALAPSTRWWVESRRRAVRTLN
jgi:hypothetical protein